MIQIIDKINQINDEVRVIHYTYEVKRLAEGMAVEKYKLLGWIPSFIKPIRKYFHNVKTKGREGSRVHAKI